jgi:glycerol transport system ATP-binding protein
VFENIASPLRVTRVRKDEIKRRVGDMAELLRLSPMLDRKPSELSGGQQQRTALARALVKDSGLVLLDEPLANPDYKLREELREELPGMLAKTGATVVYATSEPHEALRLRGQTAALDEGGITQFGPTAEVYRKPHDLTTVRVFADPPINVATVTKKGQTVRLSEDVQWQATGVAAELPDGNYSIGIRPHNVTPQSRGQNPVSVRARVLVAELTASESIVRVDVAGHDGVSQSHGIHAVDVGMDETLHIQTEHMMFFNEAGHLMGTPDG